MMTRTRPAPSAPQSPLAGDDSKVRASYGLQRGDVEPMHRNAFPVGLGCSSVTLMGVGGLGVVDSPHMLAAGVAGAALTGLGTGLAWRGDERRRVDAFLHASVERMTGPLDTWRTKRWSRGQGQGVRGAIGTPRVIKLKYRPDAALGQQNWPAPLVKLLETQVQERYKVAAHDPSRGKLVLHRNNSAASADVQKDRADRVMEQLFGADAQVVRGKDAQGQDTITIRYTNVIKASDPRFRESVEHVVDVALPGRWRATWNALEDQVRFEVRPPIPTMLLRRAPVVDPGSPDYFKVPLGQDENGIVAFWNLKSSMPHLLIAGKTGKGKTNLLEGIGQELSARQIAVWAADPKRIELQRLKSLPNVQMVVSQVEDMVAMVFQAYEEMERRYRLIETGQAKKGSFQRLVIMIDEYAEFAKRVSSWWSAHKMQGMPAKCPVLDLFESLIRLCRAADMNVVVGLQRPDTRFIEGESRDNFDARVSLGPLSRDGSMMLWESTVGTTIGLVRGRALACADGDGAPAEIQTFFTPDPTADDLDAELVELLASFEAEEVHPKLRISIPPPDVDEKKGIPLVWDAIENSRVVIDDTPRVERLVAEHTFGQTITEPKTEVDTYDLDADSDYGPAIHASIGTVKEGDLYWHEEHEEWVGIQGVVPDPCEPDCFAIAWADPDGNEGTDLVPADSRIQIRRLS